MSALTLTADGLNTHIDEWGCNRGDVLIPDAAYAFPTMDYVRDVFSPWAREKLAIIVGDYEAEDADCDDFAEVCACLAHTAHRKTLDRPRATALAFGEFWYTREDGADHAICCFVCLENNTYVLRFLEPQGCEIVNLTQKEIESCAMVRF